MRQKAQFSSIKSALLECQAVAGDCIELLRIACGDWSWTSLRKVRPAWLRDNKVRLLMQAGLRKDPDLPDLPSALDFVSNNADRRVLELFFTQKTVARPVITPPGVPPERLAALRAAFAALGQDRDFLADAERSGLEAAALAGEAVDKIIALIAATPTELAERLTKAITPPSQSR